jgi:mono/diheme cytochrome c family protein
MRDRPCGKLFTLLLMVAAVAVVSSAEAADVGHGQQLARRWCASCHIVAAGQTGPTSEAPPFATIAASERFTARKIAAFLLDPRPRMPNMELTPREAEDLAAYISSLRP